MEYSDIGNFFLSGGIRGRPRCGFLERIRGPLSDQGGRLTLYTCHGGIVVQVGDRPGRAGEKKFKGGLDFERLDDRVGGSSRGFCAFFRYLR